MSSMEQSLSDCEMADPQMKPCGVPVPADGDLKVQAVMKQKLTRTGATSAYKPHYRMDEHDDMLETAEHSKMRMQLSASSTGPEEYQQDPHASVSSIPGPSGLGRLQPCGTFLEDHRQPMHNSHAEYSGRFREHTQTPDSAEYRQVPREDALDLHYKDVEIKDPQDEDTVDHPPDLGWLLDKDTVGCEQDLKKETNTQDAPHASVMSPSLNTPQPSMAISKGLIEHGQELQGTLGTEKTSVGSAAAASSLPYTLVTSAGMLSSLVQSFSNSCSTLSPMLCSAPVNITAASSSSLSLLCTPVNVMAASSQMTGHTDSASFLPHTSIKSDGASTFSSSTVPQTTVNSKDALPPSTSSFSQTPSNSKGVSSLSQTPVNTSNAFSLPQTFLGNISSFPLLPQLLADKIAPLLASLPEASIGNSAALSVPPANTATSSSLPPSAVNSDSTPSSQPQTSLDSISKFPFLQPLMANNTTPVSLLQQMFQNSISTTCTPLSSVTVSATSSLTSVGTVVTSASSTGVCNVTSSSSSMPLTSVGLAPSSQPQTIVNNNATLSFSPQLVVYNVTPLLVVPESLYNSVFKSSSSPTQTTVTSTSTSSSVTTPLVQKSAPSASMYRPYSCKYCSAAYARPSSLTSHMKSCRHAPKQTSVDKPSSSSAEEAVDDASDKPSSPSSEAAADSGDDETGQDETEVPNDQPTCDKCNETFDTEHALKKHKKSHKDKPYKCVDCGKSFAATWHLRRHELIHTEGKKPFRCEVCPKTFAFAKVLEEHMRRHAGDRPFMCEVCNKGFYSSNYLRKHTRHHKHSKHVCDVCNKTFDFGVDLKNHKKTHASAPPGRAALPQKSGLCELCGKKFANASFLRKHVCKNENHLGKSLSCDTCGKTFTSRVCLQIHVHSKHKDWIEGLEEKSTRSERKDSTGHLKEVTPSGPEPFVCHVCGKVLKTSSTLQEHVRGHTDQKPFVCGICNKGFMHRIHLRKHQHIHTGVKDFTCEVCQKTFISSQTLKLHYKNIHLGDRPYMCDICNQGFATKTTLKLHKLKHSDEKPFVCDVCNKGFKYECVLKNHKLLHTGEKPYKCDMCEKAYVCFNYLAKHKRTHAAPKYTCDVCGKTCFFANELKNHKLSHSDEKPFLCDVCSKAFPTETRLKTHKLIHSEDKSFACHLCDKAFPSVSFLNRHLKRAHPDKSFNCDVCMKPFKHYETLRDHMNVHLNVKNFVCGECGKGFHSAGSLRTHKKLKHTEIETPYVCNVCGKGFPFQSYLKSHEKVHSKDKNLVCELCNKAVKYKLWRHMKKVHNL